MFKFMKRLPQGGHLIGLGFEEENLVRLKAGKPIQIRYNDLKLPWNGGTLVVYPSPETDELLDRLVDHLHIIRLNDESMEALREGKMIPVGFDASQIDGSEGGAMLMFWGKDNQALKDKITSMIGPKTEDASPQVDDGQHRSSL